VSASRLRPVSGWILRLMWNVSVSDMLQGPSGGAYSIQKQSCPVLESGCVFTSYAWINNPVSEFPMCSAPSPICEDMLGGPELSCISRGCGDRCSIAPELTAPYRACSRWCTASRVDGLQATLLPYGLELGRQIGGDASLMTLLPREFASV